MGHGLTSILIAAGMTLLPPSAPAVSGPRVSGPEAAPSLASEIATLDRRLFELMSVKEDAAALRALLADDFSLHHEEQGLLAASPEAFVAFVHRGFATSPLRREVIPATEAVHALARHGAIHTGCARLLGPDQARETARFFHVWRRSGGQWRLAQICTYDHRLQ